MPLPAPGSDQGDLTRGRSLVLLSPAFSGVWIFWRQFYEHGGQFRMPAFFPLVKPPSVIPAKAGIQGRVGGARGIQNLIKWISRNSCVRRNACPWL